MNHYRKSVIWLVLIGTLISACGTAAAAPPSRPSPCPPDSNVYADNIDQQIVNIYENGVAYFNDKGVYNNYRQQAFNELLNQIYISTDSVDISTGDKTIRITITYISPELIHLIIINHYLYKGIINFTGRLNEQVRNQISRIINRNEHIFFMTISAPASNNNVRILFPLSSLELTNTNNLTVYTEHDDHNLERPIVLSNEPEYGFFSFSISVTKDGICQNVLNKNDTRIVLSVPRITINENEIGPQSWEYEYAPLIDMTTVSTNHQQKFSVAFPVEQYSPNKSSLPQTDLESSDFWVSLTRIIWLETTLDP